MLKTASAVAAVTNGMADALESRFPGTDVAVIPNFFDENEYPKPVTPDRSMDKPFSIAYVSNLYGERGAYQFLEGFERFVQNNKLTPEDIVFEWAGSIVWQGDIGKWIEEHGLSEFIRYHGKVAHSDALALLQRVHVSLVLVAPDDTIHVPGKIFEAMGVRSSILLVAPEQSDAVRILEKTKVGVHATCNPDSITENLGVLFGRFLQGECISCCEEARMEYSHMEIQKRYRELLYMACGEPKKN